MVNLLCFAMINHFHLFLYHSMTLCVKMYKCEYGIQIDWIVLSVCFTACVFALVHTFTDWFNCSKLVFYLDVKINSIADNLSIINYDDVIFNC